MQEVEVASQVMSEGSKWRSNPLGVAEETVVVEL
jgi:hypothetical protein